MTTKVEIDNAYFAIVGIYKIEEYKKSEQVILDQKMHFYLNMAKASLKKIENKYRIFIQNNHKVTRRTEEKILEAMQVAVKTDSGVRVALMREDSDLICILDSIAYKFEQAITKSKNLPKEVRTAMKKFCSYWYGFEKYIIKL